VSLLTVVNAVLAFLVVEVLALVALRLSTGRGLALRLLLPMMAAGGFILLALQLALSGAPALAVIGCLAASGVAHALDVWRRWPVAGRSQ
jgi:hypothetical protein